MADDEPQQTRVLLLNGQTIILQGDAADSSINEINADLLQQALQEATGSTEPVQEQRNEEIQPPLSAETATTNAANNLVAIFQGEQGETHTIQLTMEQAEALGLHIMSDDVEKMVCTPDLPQTSPTVSVPPQIMSNDANHLVFANNNEHEDETKQIFDPCVPTESIISDIEDTSLQNDTNTTLQQRIGNLTSLPEIGSYMGDSSNITLIPQFVNGQMTYTVKVNDEPATPLQNQDFSVMESEDDSIEHEPMVERKPKLSLLSPSLPVNSLSSGSATTMSTNMSNLRVNSIPNVMNTLTPIAPCLTQTSTTNTYSSQKSLLSNLATIAPTEKTPKATYVVVPTSNTMTSTPNSLGNPMQIKGSPLLRAITRVGISSAQQSLLTNKATTAIAAVSSSTHTHSTSTLTGIPLMNSNINITRTSSTGNSLLQAVSTSLSGGGMIRVVAGGATPRITQASTTNGPKFTNILTSSGRLVSTPQTVTKKLITVNSSASGLSKSTTPIATTTTVPTVVTSESVSNSAVSAIQSTAARLNINSTKPLGSSENPIQLVQHGQTFHSVQALSQEQLRQIATVLQQQHLDSAPRTKNVLYDAETNTRIIYRVVYPEDLDLREPSSPSDKVSSERGQHGLGASGIGVRGRGRRGRPPKSALAAAAVATGGRTLGRGSGGGGALHHATDPGGGGAARLKTTALADADLDEDRLAATDDVVKGERKKQVARTRSGRLSRPPRHMVKDYKRLHHLDFADADLDDSDGGYSDYQMSDREGDELDSTGIASGATSVGQGSLTTSLNEGNTDTTGSVLDVVGKVSPAVAKVPDGATTLLPGLQTSKRKISSHFRCPTCQKVYLGHSRMARHFDMFPDHGGIDQMRNSSSTDPASPVPLPDSTQGKVGLGLLNGIVRHSGGGRRRGKRRGPWAYMTPEARSERRKIKLREALGPCEAKELSEVAGPAVAGVMSLWELLLLRVETVRTEESLMATLCEELRALLEKVQAVASEVLQPIDTSTENPSSDDPTSKKIKEEHMELQDELLCHALGLPSGVYHIVDDHLLKRQSLVGMNLVSAAAKEEEEDDQQLPPAKRLKSEDADDGIKQERKPSCPEVLSALALESKPAPLDSGVQVPAIPESSPLPTMLQDSTVFNDGSKPGTPRVQESEFPGDAKTVAVSEEEDHPFLLPPTSEMCVEDLPHDAVGDHHETVDDIVNERLKNLTGFGVSVPDVSVPHSPPPRSQPVAETEVPVTFDPEMALAAMGEGDPQPEGGSASSADALSDYAPEIALAAMGEGEREPSERNGECFSASGSGGSHFHTIKALDTSSEFDSIKAMEDEDVAGVSGALAAITEGERESSRQNGSPYQSHPVDPVFERMKSLPDDAVSRVERSLVAMGEGEQGTRGNNGTLYPSVSSDPVFSPIKTLEVDDMTGVNNALSALGDGKPLRQNGPHFSSPVQSVFSMKSIQDADVEVDVEGVDRALAAMGEGEQEPAKEQVGSPFSSTTHPIFEDVKPVEEDASVDVGRALAAMGEGHQGSPEQNEAAFSSPGEQVFESIEEHVSLVSRTSEGAPAVESKQGTQTSGSLSSSREDFSDLGLSSLETSQVDTSIEGKEELVAFTSSVLTSSENTFITSLAESSTGESLISKGVPGSDPTVSNFDPEIALAAMGEGEPCGEDSQLHHHHHSGATFDPEIALASMGEGVSSVPSSQEFQATQDPSGTDPTFQLTSMDVSLDESGAELDFDALSVEFSRTARQS